MQRLVNLIQVAQAAVLYALAAQMIAFAQTQSNVEINHEPIATEPERETAQKSIFVPDISKATASVVTYRSLSESKFYYLNSRYYDPYTGRFISPDCLIDAGAGWNQANLYAYCGNDPVNCL